MSAEALAAVERAAEAIKALWPAVVQALQDGATFDQVCEALCQWPDWTAAELISWGSINLGDAEWDALVDLVHERGGPSPTDLGLLPAA